MIPQVFDITAPWITQIPTSQVACLLCNERNLTPLNTCVLNGKRFYAVRCLADGMTITEALRRCGFAVLEFTHRYLWKPIKYPGTLWSMNVICRKLIG